MRKPAHSAREDERTAGNRMPATPSIAVRLCTSSACWNLHARGFHVGHPQIPWVACSWGCHAYVCTQLGTET